MLILLAGTKWSVSADRTLFTTRVCAKQSSATGSVEFLLSFGFALNGYDINTRRYKRKRSTWLISIESFSEVDARLERRSWPYDKQQAQSLHRVVRICQTGEIYGDFFAPEKFIAVLTVVGPMRFNWPGVTVD